MKYPFHYLIIRLDYVLTDGARIFESMSVLIGTTVSCDVVLWYCDVVWQQMSCLLELNVDGF